MLAYTGYAGVGLGSIGALTLAQAITQQENTPASWNNPGALTAAPSSYCQTGKINGIVEFCTPQDGQAALDNQLNIYANEGLTLSQMLNIYAPAPSAGNTDPMLVGNNPSAYISNVSSWTGIDPNATLSSLPTGSLYNTSTSVIAGSDQSLTAAVTGIDPTTGDLVIGGVDLTAGLSAIFYNSDGSINWYMVAGAGIIGIAVMKMVMD